MFQMNSTTQMFDLLSLAVVSANVDAERAEAAVNGTAALVVLVTGLVALLTLIWAVVVMSRRRRLMDEMRQKRAEEPMADAWEAAGKRMKVDGGNGPRE